MLQERCSLSWAQGLSANVGSVVCVPTESSGSGKTTLLNALAHRQAASKAFVEGSVYINKKQTMLQEVRRISSYVEQDDALLGSLTVKETMYFAAQLSLPR